MTDHPLEHESAKAAQGKSSGSRGLVESTEKGGSFSNETATQEPASSSTQWHPVEVKADDSHIWREDGDFWEKVKNQSAMPPGEEVDRLASEIKRKLNGGLLAFDQFRKSPTKKFIQIEDGDKDIWFVGDLHGDWLGLESVVQYVDHFDRRNDARSVITFLGDLFDRGSGERGAKVLFRVLSLINERPGRIGFVVGNHDNNLKKGANGKFTSSVYPSDFADWLNNRDSQSPWIRLAEVATEFFEYAPKALLLPDGLLVAHGGVPHTDLQKEIQSVDDFDKEKMLEDFVWTRLHETVKVRKPNRTTRGCSLGIDDFNHFCERAGEVLDREILGMLRGHDHFEERFRLFEKYEKYRVLTINTICHRLDGEMLGSFERPAIIAKWDPSKMPTVHRLEIPKEIVAEIYGSGCSESD